MLKMAWIVVWLSLGLLGLIYHLGPGVEQRALDRAGSLVRAAKSNVDRERWRDAIDQYDEALAMLPEDRAELGRFIRLQKAKAQMMASELPEARASLEALLDEILEESPGNWSLLSDTRSALASSQHYMTWLMRLEGAPKEEWEPEIEAARQNYRVLAEQAGARGDLPLANRGRADMEASIRLARLDLNELQGLPLPSQ